MTPTEPPCIGIAVVEHRGLFEVEQEGETFLVSRAGKVVAAVSRPPAAATGARLLEILRETPPDPEWLNDILAVRSLLYTEDRYAGEE